MKYQTGGAALEDLLLKMAVAAEALIGEIRSGKVVPQKEWIILRNEPCCIMGHVLIKAFGLPKPRDNPKMLYLKDPEHAVAFFVFSYFRSLGYRSYISAEGDVVAQLAREAKMGEVVYANDRPNEESVRKSQVMDRLKGFGLMLRAQAKVAEAIAKEYDFNPKYIGPEEIDAN